LLTNLRGSAGFLADLRKICAFLVTNSSDSTGGFEKTIVFAGLVVIFWSLFLIGRDAFRRESMGLGNGAA